ncbi:MAG: alpha/beta hydrolase family protein [Henriciella sp.]
MNMKAFFATLALGFSASVPMAAQAEPTIPVEVWADESDFRSLEMSFDGSKMAMLQRTERGGEYQVVVFDTNDIAGSLRRLDTGNDAEPRSLTWVNDETIVIEFRLERKRRKELLSLNRYLAFNVNTGESVNLLKAPSIDRNTSAVAQQALLLAQGSIVDYLRTDFDHILMSVNEGTAINIYKVNVNTGARELVLKGNSDIAAVGFDWEGDPRTAQGYDPDGPAVLLFAREKGSTMWKEVARRDARDRKRIQLLGFHDPDAPNKLYFVADTEESDNTGLFTMDVANPDEWTPVFEPEGYDVLNVLRSPRLSDREAITGYLYAGDHRRERYYTDPEIGSIFSSIQQSFPDKNVSIINISQDSSTVLFFVSGPRDPGTYYMIKDGAASKVVSVDTTITPDALSRVEGIMAQARDGYEIPALVTIPDGEGPFPGIVMPHGGPWVRDYYGYDEWAQMLAHQGYVVVQPNYRGSEGHGLAHWRAGDNEWGQLMQNDIEDSLFHVVNEGLVDPDKLAIFGWSYGGYAAFVGATRPDTPFNCSVAGAGISDIAPIRGSIGDSRFLRKYQEPTVSGFSAISRVKDVTMPMLVVHGEDDATVPVDQSRIFVRDLKRNDADYDYIEIKDMFHSPWRYEHNIAWFPELLEFFETKCNF